MLLFRGCPAQIKVLFSGGGSHDSRSVRQVATQVAPHSINRRESLRNLLVSCWVKMLLMSNQQILP